MKGERNATKELGHGEIVRKLKVNVIQRYIYYKILR